MKNKIIIPMDELYIELKKLGWNEPNEKASEKGWNPKSKEYIRIRDKGYIKSEHRVVWERHNGKIPKGMLIHHIDGDTKNNKIENLKMTNFKEHMKMHRGHKK